MKATFVVAVCVTTLFLLGAQSHRDMFSKYKTFEAYQVRPTIIAVPRYAADGQICEIGLQKILYSPNRVNLDPNLFQQEISSVVEELVPEDERGPKKPFPRGEITEVSGDTASITTYYENIYVETFSDPSWDTSRKVNKLGVRNIRLALIRWRNRKCF